MKKLIVFLVTVLGGLIALVILAIVALNIYLSTLPAAKTMRAAGILSIPTPFRLRRPFIDYMTINGSRLYAGYASEGMVGVVDTASNQSVTTIDGLTRVHGIAVVPDCNLGFASSSGDNVVGVFDLNTNKLLQKIPAGDDPDAIIFDEQAHLVYVANHNGKTGMLIDPATQKVVATISLGGEPEYPQADPATGLIYQNLEDTSELVVIDPQKQAVVKRYKLDPGEGTGLALDAEHHRLFSTTGNRKLIVLNAENGAIVDVLPIGAAVDGAGYDPALRRVYTATGLAPLPLFNKIRPDEYRVLENTPTHFGGNCSSSTHRLTASTWPISDRSPRTIRCPEASSREPCTCGGK